MTGRDQKQRGNERGATLVWVALAMVALVGMMALALDGGFGYAQRRRMQNAADAAAIAGARLVGLGANTTQVGNAVHQYGTTNGATVVNWTYLTSQGSVQVTTQVTFTTFFAGVVGINEMTASGFAEASLDYLSSSDDLLPMAIEKQDFVFKSVYELWNDDHEAPGNFGWLDWNGGSPSAPELADNIAHPINSGYWQIGDWVDGCPGTTSSNAVRSAVAGWLEQHVTVIVYDAVQETGNNTTYQVSGFAEFVIDGYDLTGGDKRVWGHFIRWVEPGPGGGPNLGLSAVLLTQ